MKKMLLLATLAIFAFAALPVIAQDAPAVPTDPITMKYTDKPVVFPHDRHEKVDCVKCHHLVDGKENYQLCGSAGCHDDFEQKSKDKLSYYKVIHTDKDGCVACHKKEAPKDLKKAMTSCTKSSCHP